MRGKSKEKFAIKIFRSARKKTECTKNMEWKLRNQEVCHVIGQMNLGLSSRGVVPNDHSTEGKA